MRNIETIAKDLMQNGSYSLEREGGEALMYIATLWHQVSEDMHNLASQLEENKNEFAVPCRNITEAMERLVRNEQGGEIGGKEFEASRQV